MEPAKARILTINGGSSSIKFALFETGETLRRILQGELERIGLPKTTLRVKGGISQLVNAPDHSSAVSVGRDALATVGHRVVHGGPKHSKPQRITSEIITELRRLSSFDPEHLPQEILLAEAFQQRFPDLPQVACFHTAFHHDLPRVAGTAAAQGRVILAHLGNGAGLAAVREGKSVDTSMSFTPAAGVPMSTRSGDLDPGLVWYFARTEGLDAKRFNEMVNVLLPKMDRCIRSRIGRIGHAGVHCRHRRECAHCPLANLQWPGIPWNRIRRTAKRGKCGRDLHGGQPGYGTRHSNRRGTHDSQDGLPRSQSWLRKRKGAPTMNLDQLLKTATAMIAGDKGLLAMDESTPTCNKRFAKLGIPQTVEARRDYRDLIVTTPGLAESISGAILFDETIRQTGKDGTPFVKVLTDAGIIPGIKVDEGAKDMALHPDEKITEGLDGLHGRLAEYSSMGARFAKWRAVITIGEGIPTRGCIEANAQALARYAALCQEAGLVPIVEPEVLMDGDHSMARCEQVTEEVLHIVFHRLYAQRVLLEGMILKPNMVLPGLACPKQESVERGC